MNQLISQKLKDIELILERDCFRASFNNKLESLYLAILKSLSNVCKPDFLKNHVVAIIEKVMTLREKARGHPVFAFFSEDFFLSVINKGCGTKMYELIQKKIKDRDFSFFVFILKLSKQENFYSFRERMMRESILKSAHEEFLMFIFEYFKRLSRKHPPHEIGPKFEKKDFFTLWLNIFYQLMKHNEYYISQDKPLQKMQELNLFVSYNNIVNTEPNLKTVMLNPFFNEIKIMKKVLLKTYCGRRAALFDLYYLVQIVAGQKHFWWPKLLRAAFTGKPKQDAQLIADLLLRIFPCFFPLKNVSKMETLLYYKKKTESFFNQPHTTKPPERRWTFQVFLSKVVVPYLRRLRKPLPGIYFEKVFKLVNEIVQVLFEEKRNKNTKVTALDIQEFLKVNLEILRKVDMKKGHDSITNYMVSIFTFFWKNIVNPWKESKDLPILCKLIISELIQRHEHHLQKVQFNDKKCQELYQSVIMDINDNEFDEYYQSVWMEACASIVPYMNLKAPDRDLSWLETFRKGKIHTSEEFSDESKLSVKSSFWIFIVSHRSIFLPHFNRLIRPEQMLKDLDNFISNGKNSKLTFNIFLLLLVHLVKVKHKLTKDSNLTHNNDPSELTFNNLASTSSKVPMIDRVFSTPYALRELFFFEEKDTFPNFRNQLMRLLQRFMLSYSKEPMLLNPDTCYLFGLFVQIFEVQSPISVESVKSILERKYNTHKLEEDPMYKDKVLECVKAQLELLRLVLHRGRLAGDYSVHKLLAGSSKHLDDMIHLLCRHQAAPPHVYFRIFALYQELYLPDEIKDRRVAKVREILKDLEKFDLIAKFTDGKKKSKFYFINSRFILVLVFVSLILKHGWDPKDFDLSLSVLQKYIERVGAHIIELSTPQNAQLLGYTFGKPADPTLLDLFAGLEEAPVVKASDNPLFRKGNDRSIKSNHNTHLSIKTYISI